MQPATTAEWTCTRWMSALVASVVVAGPLQGQQTDSTAWMRRPAIREIRAIVQDVQRSVDQRRLARSDTTMCAGGPLEIAYQVYRDRRGLIRRLVWASASEDHGEVVTFTYDSLGRLRFAFSKQAAVNGSKGEVRSYWDAAGSQLLVDIKTTEGEGYPWGPPRPEFEPAQVIPRGCEE